MQAWSTTNAFPAFRATSIVRYFKLQMVKAFLIVTANYGMSLRVHMTRKGTMPFAMTLYCG